MNTNDYPKNLIEAIAGLYMYKPKLITDDIIAGINYAIFTLAPIEQEFVSLRFREDMNLDDVSAKLNLPIEDIEDFENKLIKKLRHPWVYRYILHGIVGYTLYKSIAEFFNGYNLGYVDAQDGKESLQYRSKTPTLSLETPSIEILGLSKRVFNCLIKAGIHTIGDCLMLRTDDIHGIRGLGSVGADEVAQSFVKAHIYSYNWEQFLIQPRSSRDWDEYHVEII